MIGLNLVVKNHFLIFTMYMLKNFWFNKNCQYFKICGASSPFYWERERKSSLYTRSANTLEINFPLPTEIISTISSFTHIGHHTIVALCLIIWRSSIPRRMFSTIETLDRDRAIYSSAKKNFLAFNEIVSRVVWELEGQIGFLVLLPFFFLHRINFLKTKEKTCFVFYLLMKSANFYGYFR